MGLPNKKTKDSVLLALHRKSMFPYKAFLAVFLAIFFIYSNQTEAQESEPEINLLSLKDQELYRQIFELQKDGKWAGADQLIGQLSNPVLMGHVQFQRYMHPSAYRSSFSELSTWMANYADLPGANRIYRLAKKRQGNAKSPKRPVPIVAASLTGGPQPALKQRDTRSKSDRNALSRFNSRFKREIRRNNSDRAEKRLWAFEARGIFTEQEFINALTDLAENYFFTSNDEKALALGNLAIALSPSPLTQANWITGLAAWRSGACEEAILHFSNLANGATTDRWILSAGAFWAARSSIACRQPENVNGYLKIAAGYKETFYGLVAMRQLGIAPDFEWDPLPLTDSDYQALYQLPGVKRTIALAEVGRYDLADSELRLVWSRRQHDNHEPVIALAYRLDLPATQATMARSVPNGDQIPDSAFFPVPTWEPEGGFTIDRALLFGFMRQESHFIPRARSGAGAMGLMQLMPATASFIMRDRSLRWSSKYKLLEPETNMAISQVYMHHLLDNDITDGNLLKFATAYNGGPGNLGRWQNRIEFDNDPFLFIETIPARETRNFIEKVVANFWIYRIRFGQPTPSLSAAAAGAWPVYESLDQEFAHIFEPPENEEGEISIAGD